MGAWNHRYTGLDIGAGTTITNHFPGLKIADAITEIQERVPNEVSVDSDFIGAELSGNVLSISGNAEDVINNYIEQIETNNEYNEFDQHIENIVNESGAGLPEGGADGEVLQRDANGNAYFGPLRAL